MSKEFHIGDVLSITTGILASPDGMVGVHNILEYMMAQKLFDGHSILLASEMCKPKLLQQHPELAEIDISAVDTEKYREWVAEMAEKYGETLLVEPLRRD